ncbi:hypothetical protein N752_15070 [Desulforamulus aquiferis]|nr:hypothetical protein N752_15070 [Desulforamulus aquiferis]
MPGYLQSKQKNLANMGWDLYNETDYHYLLLNIIIWEVKHDT